MARTRQEVRVPDVETTAVLRFRATGSREMRAAPRAMVGAHDRKLYGTRPVGFGSSLDAEPGRDLDDEAPFGMTNSVLHA
jgi:hypothetical protein